MHYNIFLEYCQHLEQKTKQKIKKRHSFLNASVKLIKGEINMRAIDTLFDEIDKINSQIKIENKMQDKLFLIHQIRKIIEIIDSIEELRIQRGDNDCI